MRPLNAAAFTLVELLLGLSLLGLLGGMVTVVMRCSARTSTHAVANLGTTRTLLAFDQLLREELRDAADTELTTATATQLGMWRMIGEAPVCAAAGSSVTLSRAEWNGTRSPAADHDEVMLLVNPDSSTWQRARIARIGSTSCPADTAGAWRLDLDTTVSTARIVRVMESVVLSAYRSGSADWLGLAPADGTASVQPFAGPLDPGAARFFTSAGALVTRIRPQGAALVERLVPLSPRP